MAAMKAPAGLGDAGVKLWRDVTGKYELRADEFVILEAACAARDRVVAMEAERNGAVTASGSMGQLVVHPLMAEIRAHEAQIAGLLAKLKLPDEGVVEMPNQNRAAAQSKWASAYGAAS